MGEIRVEQFRAEIDGRAGEASCRSAALGSGGHEAEDVADRVIDCRAAVVAERGRLESRVGEEWIEDQLALALAGSGRQAVAVVVDAVGDD